MLMVVLQPRLKDFSFFFFFVLFFTQLLMQNKWRERGRERERQRARGREHRGAIGAKSKVMERACRARQKKDGDGGKREAL